MFPEASWMFPAFAAAVTLVICLIAGPLCGRLDLIDVPTGRKMHGAPTPLVGGLVLLFAALPVLAYALAFDDMLIQEGGGWMFLLVVGGIAGLGLSDDRHAHSALGRFVIGVAFFAMAASAEPLFLVRLLHFEHPALVLGLMVYPLAVAFTAICMAGLVNALNMADGKNGLVIGLCLSWLALLYSRAPSGMHLPIQVFVAVLAVLLAFNLRGKVFLGDGGAYGIAACLGLMAIALYNSPGTHPVRAISAEEVAVVFAVPILDMFRLIVVRWKRGSSPMEGDRDHLHHHLLDRFGWPAGLFAYWVVAVGPATLLFLLG